MTDTPTRADRTDKLDWYKVAKLAGKHGVNYRTGIGLTMFLMEMFSDEAAALTAKDERIAALEGEVERLRIAEVAANQRAALAEDRLYSFRQGRASTGKALAEFIKARAPDLWPDYAAVSVNKSVYSDDYVQEPTWERQMNILRHRAEKAEDEATTLRAALKGTDHDPAQIEGQEA